MSVDWNEVIETAASEPAEVETDGQRVKAQSLKDLVEADKYLKGSAGATLKSRGLRFTRLAPPDAT